MRVLTVYAHPNPASFCHAVLEQFTKGLVDAGHASEVVDLYAIWGLRYPGVKKVEHVYFYGAAIASDDIRRGYLKRAYELGQGFAQA